MQAALHVPGDPNLKIVDDFEIPKPGPKQVLLKIQASGVCHTDVFLLSTSPNDARTYIMGHEATGIAVSVGAKVFNIQKGKRYVVLSLGGCIRCLGSQRGMKSAPSGTPVEQFFNTPAFGLGGNGGHAEFAVVDAEQLVPVPENVLPEHAAVMGDAGITAWHALNKTAGIKKGEKVLITGIGGLGALAVQFAIHLGAEVYAVDIRPSSRELALELGARNAFTLVELDEALAKGFQVDCAVDFVSSDTTFQKEVAAVGNNALQSNLEKFGRIVIVGASDHNLVTNALPGIIMGLQVRYSVYGTKEDLIEALDLVSKGIVRPIVDKVPLHEANVAYNGLRANTILSRRVLIPPSFFGGEVRN